MHIISAIFQDLREPGRLNDIDEADSEGGGENEAVSTCPGDEAEYTDAGYGDGGVEENLHVAKDGRRLSNFVLAGKG